MTAPRPPLDRRSNGLLWVAVVAVVCLVEGYAIAARNGATLSHLVRAQLALPLGRLLLYPLWMWLTWHWFLAPSIALTRRDAIAVGVGLLAALITLWRGVPRF